MLTKTSEAFYSMQHQGFGCKAWAQPDSRAEDKAPKVRSSGSHEEQRAQQVKERRGRRWQERKSE